MAFDSRPMSPEEHKEYNKRHEKAELHPIIDAVYDFAVRHQGEFLPRPISRSSWHVYWSDPHVSRGIQVSFNDDHQPAELQISTDAWHDDEVTRRRFHGAGPRRHVLLATIDVPDLVATLERAYEEVMALTDDDLKSVTDPRKP